MAAASTEEEIQKTIDDCFLLQKMIDISTNKLYGLRQCLASTPSNQALQAIRESENKLVQMFSKQIILKAKLRLREYPPKLVEYPHTDQWLEVIGLPSEVSKALIARNSSLDTLLKTSPDVLALTMKDVGADEQDTILLNRALGKLKAWTESQINGNTKAVELYWAAEEAHPPGSPYMNWSAKSASLTSQASSASLTSRSSVSSASSQSDINANTGSSHGSPVSPGLAPTSANSTSAKLKGRFPTTPPPDRKNNIQVRSGSPLVKSTSQESRLSQKVEHTRTLSSTDEEDKSAISDSGTIPKKSSSLPRTSQQSPHMMHKIEHRFDTKKMISRCSYCKKHIYLHHSARLCRYCKYRCHKECEPEVAKYSCGLPDEYLEYARKIIAGNRHGSLSGNASGGSSSLGSYPRQHHQRVDSGSASTSSSLAAFPSQPSHQQHLMDSCSASVTSSSSSSSNPSSPLLFPVIYHTSVSAQASPRQASDSFNFSMSQPHIDRVPTDDALISASEGHIVDFINSTTSNDSDNTIISAYSDRTLPDRTGSIDSQDFDSHSLTARQTSLSKALEEWDIPYAEVNVGKKIGTGRFGTVFSGEWHGPVAVKKVPLNPHENLNDQLTAFRQEIAILKKTRHENIVLFMGACMKEPDLAIVTSYVNGSTLFVLTRKERWNINRVCLVASQTAQGMGYLHSKGIIHKDLTTKNIFLDRERVIITDFGLSNVMRLASLQDRGDGSLLIPRGWLCYLAAEIMCVLQAGDRKLRPLLPFSAKTDVYAFGTVFYELLVGEWPFAGVEPEVIIWQVGRGMKQSLGLVQASRAVLGSKEVKDLLMRCWMHKADDRPNFTDLLHLLERLPKKRLARSPSYPVNLSRSVELIFKP